VIKETKQISGYLIEQWGPSPAGLYWATSPDLPGLLVAETSPDERDRMVPIAIGELLRARAL
jgi:hypothetical protein